MKIGLALSGAVARGVTHLGVLRAFEEHGLPIHCVAGVSAGAVVGTLYAAGYRAEGLLPLVGELGWRRFLTPTWPRFGLFSMIKVEWWARRFLGNRDLRDLPLPCGIGLTDFDTGAPVAALAGPAAVLMRAASSVPGFVSPVWVNGRRLCDGGISNNLPVTVARALGADVVIGVDLFVPHQRDFGALSVGLFTLENLVRRSGGGLAQADVLIAPHELAGTTYFDFGPQSQHTFYDMGYRAGCAAWPRIEQALQEAHG